MGKYEKSIKELKKKIQEKDISVEEWNTYANDNNLFSAIVLIDREDVENWNRLKHKYIELSKKNFLFRFFGNLGIK